MQIRNSIIIGSGPAGYTAAIYLARADVMPLLLSGEKSGGQLMWTTEVENYPGFPQGKIGPELMMDMRAQALRFGTEMIDKFVTAVDFSKRPFRLWVEQVGAESIEELILKARAGEIKEFLEKVKKRPHNFEAKSVIISTGALAILLGVPGEREYLGRGVSTCAVCDAAFYRDKNVFVVGGGDAAMEDTLALTKYAKHITLIHRRDNFKASKIMQRRVLVEKKEKIDVLWNSEVTKITGNGQRIEEIEVVNNIDGKKKMFKADGLFVAIGHKPMTQIFEREVKLDKKGYVITRLGLEKESVEMAEENLSEEGLVKYPTMTSVEGVFAAGDVVDFRYKQAVTAAGYGCMAALDAEKYLEENG